jgi:hypothetical protein
MSLLNIVGDIACFFTIHELRTRATRVVFMGDEKYIEYDKVCDRCEKKFVYRKKARFSPWVRQSQKRER